MRGDRSRQASRIDLIVWVVCSAMIAAVQPPFRFADEVGLSRDALVEELGAMVFAYLGETRPARAS
jgi:hypothetical protein